MIIQEEQAVVASPALREVVRQARLFARTSAAVLLTGESGTGKEWIARLIHEASPRAQERYVRVNCAALPEALLESELFGHERGAFTGAVESRQGRLEWAGTGTLLLDEVGEIPLGLQAKLLRVLEEQEFQRLGQNESRRVEARFIATTNRALEERVADGEFRLDLLYRLNVLEIQVPPLRERPEDVAPLVRHFVQRFQADAALPIRGVSDEALQLLQARAWPGNVRELRNVVHRACVVNTSGLIEPRDLPSTSQPPLHLARGAEVEQMRLDDIERNAILTNLRKFAGNKTAAARHLGVSSRTLSNKMKRYQELGYVG